MTEQVTSTSIVRRQGINQYFPRCTLTDDMLRDQLSAAMPIENTCRIGATHVVPIGHPDAPDGWVWHFACPHHYIQWQSGRWQTLRDAVAKAIWPVLGPTRRTTDA